MKRSSWLAGIVKQKSLAFLSLLILTAALGACSKDQSVELANGSDLSLNAQQILVVNYWAKWCKPCLHEIPELNRLNQQDGITVVGFDFDKHQGQELNDLIAKMKIEFPVLAGHLEPNRIHPELTRKAQALPMTYLIRIPNPESGEAVRLSKALLGPQTEVGLLAKIEKFQSQL
ncbi:TlpA disulfide reductase family protein [Pseudoteredinibacter isoporae]|uniref:Thiol-disulfide isomerase/thioredoxin n=1 Tax=Pseudoteredinibacter isoporae TaxID=570281 RepID=A0A7X0JTV3_9GAMM|nr:TlpA disulfide reductase family protein [Pseudoteredinibacter isoporae]MBB6522159.1 thiol-disulfide isomerase/thioredoxin [Pseudoteredinibacter isoporae]NHO87694.1 TlpA family protein disulfide reductase [Pseudoteredinibacter isoporae]NIB23975.1 TlpA family protein disulfide reductase [Pseudoteredinibacter isoporae]